MPLDGAPDYLRAEIAFAATHEQVLHLEDVMLHRTRLTYEHKDGGLAALDEITDILSPILGWDAARGEQEKQSYRDRRAAEAAAAQTSSDADGALARAQAPEIVPMRALDAPA